jgi:DNA recombination protein RmuC
MSPTVLTVALCAILLASFVAITFAWLTRRDVRTMATDQPSATRLQVESGIRQEVDRLRSDSTEQARALRQEVGDNVRGFQGTVLQSFTSLGEQQTEQMRSFGEEVKNGFARTEQRTSEIAQRVADELLKIAATGTSASDRLRIGVESKLDQFGERSANAARELRDEVAGGVKTLHESVTLTLDTRLQELTTTTSTQSQATRSDITTGLTRVTSAVSETLQQLGTQQKERLDSLSQIISSLSERQAHAQETLRQTVEGRLDAIRTENVTKLDEMRKTVDEKLQSTLEARLGESFRLVSQQLESVHKGLGEMQSLAAGVGDLKKVMTNVKARGVWGEIQLGNLLEQFLAPDQYIQNAQIREDSQERVEFAVRFPGRGSEKELLLPIDAKFPQEDFGRIVAAAEASDASAVEAAASALETRITNYAKSIREKYIHSPTTTDFAILFLPTEGLYAEVLRRPGLSEHLQREHHVSLAGPTTLAAMLNAFQMGFRSLAIEKRSSEVWRILGAVRTEFEKHADVVGSLRKQLSTAVNTIDRLDTRTRVMNRKLRDVELLPEATAETMLELNALGDSEQDEVSDEPAAEQVI